MFLQDCLNTVVFRSYSICQVIERTFHKAMACTLDEYLRIIILACLVPPLRLHYHERNHGQAQAWSFAGRSLPSKRTASLKAAEMGSWQDGVQDPKDDLKLRVIAIFVLLIVRFMTMVVIGHVRRLTKYTLRML